MRWLLFALALCVVGCTPSQRAKWKAEGVETAVATNNGMVAALDKLEAKVGDRHETATIAAAKAAATRAEGTAALDELDAQYDKIADALKTAENVQGVLAAALEAAREAIKVGKSPDITKVLGLYNELQAIYNAIMVAISEAG